MEILSVDFDDIECFVEFLRFSCLTIVSRRPHVSLSYKSFVMTGSFLDVDTYHLPP